MENESFASFSLPPKKLYETMKCNDDDDVGVVCAVMIIFMIKLF